MLNLALDTAGQRPPGRMAGGWCAVLRLVLSLGLLVGLLGSLPVGAQDVLPVPALTARVIDQTATLGEAQRAALEAKLVAFEREAGTQIVVLIVPTTKPEDDFSYASRVANTWKIGRKDVGDGLLLIVAKNDRRVRIEVAKSLEGAIPDLAARQIIDRQITPAFKAGNFAGGIDAAVDALSARVRGENLPAPARPDAQPGAQFEEVGIFLLVAAPIIGKLLTGFFGRFFGSLAASAAVGAMAWWWTASVLLAGAAGVLTLVVVGILGFGATRGGGGGGGIGPRSRGGPPVIFGGGGSGWGGGGGGFSSGGGGFSSGGGGDFGGGGASGSW